MPVKYSDEQIARVVKKNFVSFSEFISEVKESAPDPKFIMHVDRLLMTIFLHYLEGRYLSKTQACRMIPAEHIDTCKKYVTEAERLGFIKLVPDDFDKRKIKVIPTDQFVSFVRINAAEALDEALAIAGEGHATRRKN